MKIKFAVWVNINLKYDDEILSIIAQYAGGDARVALNILEQAGDVALEQNHNINKKLLKVLSVKKFKHMIKMVIITMI